MTFETIIEMNADPKVAIAVDKILTHRERVYEHYREEFTSKPMLMITDVFNAVQYGKIVPSEEMHEAIEEYLMEDEEEREYLRDLIMFQSILLSDLLEVV